MFHKEVVQLSHGPIPAQTFLLMDCLSLLCRHYSRVSSVNYEWFCG